MRALTVTHEWGTRNVVDGYLTADCLRKAMMSARSWGRGTRKSMLTPGMKAPGSVSHWSRVWSFQVRCAAVSAAE